MIGSIENECLLQHNYSYQKGSMYFYKNVSETTLSHCYFEFPSFYDKTSDNGIAKNFPFLIWTFRF